MKYVAVSFSGGFSYDVKALSHCCVHWYTLTYARDKLGIGYIRFEHAGKRCHTLAYARTEIKCSAC